MGVLAVFDPHDKPVVAVWQIRKSKSARDISAATDALGLPMLNEGEAMVPAGVRYRIAEPPREETFLVDGDTVPALYYIVEEVVR